MAELSKTFCPLPFIHSHASVGGHWKPCCNSDHWDTKDNYFTTKTNHGDIEFLVVANTKWFNSLSSKHKEIIMSSAMMAEKDVRDKVSAIEADAYALAKSKGMKIVTPSDADIDAFKKASKPVYEAYKKNAGKLGEQLLDAASKL